MQLIDRGRAGRRRSTLAARGIDKWVDSCELWDECEKKESGSRATLELSYLYNGVPLYRSLDLNEISTSIFDDLSPPFSPPLVSARIPEDDTSNVTREGFTRNRREQQDRRHMPDKYRQPPS